MKLVWASILAALLFAATASAQVANAAGASGPGGSASPVAAPGDDFAPGVFLVVIFILCVVALIFLTVLFVAAIVGGALVLLTAFGVVSISILTGVARRSVSAAFRTFFLLSGSLIGMPIGIGALALLSRLMHDTLPWRVILPVGIILGSATGFLTAVAINFAWGKATARLLARPPRGFEVASAPVSVPNVGAESGIR
jgi:hypothetical protein